MNITFQRLVELFLLGEKEGYSGTRSLRGNLSLKEGKLYHYSTVLAEHYEEKIIINITRYSLQTGKVQKLIKQLVPLENQITVKKVPRDYQNSLTAFLEK